jgi:hypothetical protein
MTTKIELTDDLKELGVEIPPGASLPELKALLARAKKTKPINSEEEYGKLKSAVMNSLSSLQKPILAKILTGLGQVVYKAQTKGDLLLEIRELTQVIQMKKISFGKHKGLIYADLVANYPQYRNWAIKEVERSSECNQQLREFAIFSRLNLTKGFSDWITLYQDEQEQTQEQMPKSPDVMEGIDHQGGPDEENQKSRPSQSKVETKSSSSRSRKDAAKIPVPRDESEEEEQKDAVKFRRVPVKQSKFKTPSEAESSDSWIEAAEDRKKKSSR